MLSVGPLFIIFLIRILLPFMLPNFCKNSLMTVSGQFSFPSCFNGSTRRVACDKINADGGEENTKSFAQGERFVQEHQSEHGAANDKHAVDRDDDAGRPFG